MKIYLVQGVFFQCGGYTIWSGLLCPQEESGQLVGEIQDIFGVAEVSEVALDEAAGTLSFVKCYHQREDRISYQFTRRPDGVWKGTYSGSATGVDAARCVLTVVGEDFFTPPAQSPVSAN